MSWVTRSMVVRRACQRRRTSSCIRIRVNASKARIGRVQTGNKAKQRRLSAATGPDERNQFTRGERKSDPIEHQSSSQDIVGYWKAFADFAETKRRSFGAGNCYHLITPFCQTST